MLEPIIAQFPSNIALVKYWGKHGFQLPCNASLSMTLSKAQTEVKLFCSKKEGKKPSKLTYHFDGKLNEDFGHRVMRYVAQQPEFSALLQEYDLYFESKNSFPHSAGIASSASSFAAIAAVLLKASNILGFDFKIQASRLARLGSGSACRSFYGPYAQWGQLKEIADSSNEYAIPVRDIHDNFKQMRDAILIVENQPKKVSSSVGHALMKGHPFAQSRFEQANKHCIEMISVLKNGDFDSFISITEREALSLHAMMMTSGDYYLLMKPDSVRIIEHVFQFRKETGLPLCFTLDAGPNVHLLYPESIQDKVHSFLEHYLQRYGLKSIIYDEAGVGGTIS